MGRVLRLLAVLLLLARPVCAQIAFDAATDGGNNGGSTTSLTFSHTTTGSNRILIVCAALGTAPDAATVTATYNSVSMTQIDRVNNATTQNRSVVSFLLVNPASGSNSVVITRSNTDYILGGAASYTGAQQSGQPDAHTTNDGGGAVSTLTSSVTTVADNAWTVICEGGYNASNAPAAGTGSTRRTFDAAFGTWGLFDSNGVVHPAGSHSMTTTRTSADNNIIHLMHSLAPTGGSPPACTPTLTLLGVGRCGDH